MDVGDGRRQAVDRPWGLSGTGRYNPGIGRPRRLAGRRLDAAGIHRQWGDTP